LHEDIEDMNAVVSYLKATYGYEIELIVGHSRGSLVGLRWVSTTDEGRKVSALINVSGRYRMRVSLSTSP
jgi:pimeloyl-ACP methyl ester carboxylesterase